jgi:DNA-binding MarR family transcriptional regulator
MKEMFDTVILHCYNHVVTSNERRDPYTLMELFLLGVVTRGKLRSMYELQRTAGLEPGGVQPALRRLEKQELLVRSKEARRRRRLIEVTEKGRQVLEQQWSKYIKPYPDAESVLRAAGLAVLMGQPQYAGPYLISMSNDYERKAGAGQANSMQPQPASPLQLYGSMRAMWQTRRHQSAAGVFRDIANELAMLQLNQ